MMTIEEPKQSPTKKSRVGRHPLDPSAVSTKYMSKEERIRRGIYPNIIAYEKPVREGYVLRKPGRISVLVVYEETEKNRGKGCLNCRVLDYLEEQSKEDYTIIFIHCYEGYCDNDRYQREFAEKGLLHSITEGHFVLYRSNKDKYFKTPTHASKKGQGRYIWIDGKTCLPRDDYNSKEVGEVVELPGAAAARKSISEARQEFREHLEYMAKYCETILEAKREVLSDLDYLKRSLAKYNKKVSNFDNEFSDLLLLFNRLELE